MAEHAPFKPKRLPSMSVDAPLQRHWDVMGSKEAARLHARAQDEAIRFSFFGPRTRRRLLRYLVLTPIGFAFLGWFFVGGDVRTAGLFFLVGLPLGALMMAFKPSDFLCGLFYGLAGAAATVATGRASLFSLGLGSMVIGTIGIALGRVEELRRMDMED